MKVSINTVRGMNRRYGCADDIAPHGVDELVEKIGAQLGAVEEVVDVGSKYQGVLVVKVVSCEDHPDATRLHVCKIDDGHKVEGATRDEQGLVTVVCGAPNVRAGMLAAWLPPGSTVPDSIGKEPFVLEARPLRGVVSNGMLASPRELALGDQHDGILEVDKPVDPGTPFAEVYELAGDHVIDIENKMFTHRPDCFGFLGVARELAGIQHMPFKSPDWYRPNPEFPGVEAEELPLEMQNELPDVVPRFTAMTMRGIKVGPSPVAIQIELIKAGVRPINNIVDYTNFFMLETGQPLHAYDYDKVKAQDQGAGHATLAVRRPKAGEKITLLGGKQIEPHPGAIMIATRDTLIGLGGVMGGADTEVDENTTNIIIECANFDMYSVRRTAMRHGLFTDAGTRFTKGQSPLQNLAVLAKIVDEIRRFAGGKVASPFIDDNHLPQEVLERNALHQAVTTSRQFVNERLGIDLSAQEMSKLLTNVEFKVNTTDETLHITAPFWRTDIAIPEDIVEEVGRLYGYDRLPLTLPKRGITPAPPNALLDLKERIRSVLAAAGANELLTYSFVHGNLLDKASQDRAQAFQIANALSPDLQYYRLSLLPNLLEKVHPNIKAGYNELVLFEMGKLHNIMHAADPSDGLPKEFESLGVVVAANDKQAGEPSGAAFYQARYYLDHLMRALGLPIYYQPVPTEVDFPLVKPFDHKRSAYVALRATNEILGVVGEFKPSVARNLKLPRRTAGFEIGLAQLIEPKATSQRAKQYTPLPRFPKIEQDICLKVPQDTSYDKVYQFVWDKLAEVQPENTLPGLGPVDIYRRSDDPDHKQVTLRFTIASYDRTLTDDEVSKLLDHVAQAAKTELNAERI